MRKPKAALTETDVLRSLLNAGLELGVAEATRRLAGLLPAVSSRTRKLEIEGLLGAAAVTEFVQAVKGDPGSVFQLVKEVWSRGGTKERTAAARAVGRGLGKWVPHQALGLSRDLAAMSRNAKEADLVGVEAIEPVLEVAPPLVERVKQFLLDNERWVRRAAIAGLVAYVSQKRKLTGLTLEAILLLAEHNEKEIRDAVRWGVRELSKVDWKTSARVLAAWAKEDLTGQRLKLAKSFVGGVTDAASRNVQDYVVARLAKLANGHVPKPRRR